MPSLLCPPAAAGARPTSVPGGLQSHGHFFGLFQILIRRAPEEEASGNPADGHGYLQFRCHTQDPVFHGGRACTLWERHPGC